MDQYDAPSGGPPEERGDDYGYDLAHEAMGAQEVDPDRPSTPPATVVTESSDHDQDYSYDLAHDIPEIRDPRRR